MLQAYLPGLVFILLGGVAGLLLTNANRLLGPRRPSAVKREPYESGMPSRGMSGQRFGVSYYMVGMMFIIFDVEVILLYPVALHLEPGARYALLAIGAFIMILVVALVYELVSGALNLED